MSEPTSSNAPQRQIAQTAQTASTASTLPNRTKISERRLHNRERVSSIAYVSIGTGNGGIVLNVSEGGLSLAAAASLRCEPKSQIRVRLPGASDWIELEAEFVWTSESKRQAGVKFVETGEEAQKLIRGWIALEAPPVTSRFTVPAVKEGGAPGTSGGMKGVSSAATARTVLKSVNGATQPGNSISRQRNSIAPAEAAVSAQTKKGTPVVSPARKRSGVIAWLSGTMRWPKWLRF